MMRDPGFDSDRATDGPTEAAVADRVRARIAARGAPPGRPFVTLTYAQSLDGSIAARRGRPLVLSGPEARRLTHRLRAAHDAILVGVGTILSDDPRLTVRHATGADPLPVVLDSRLRTPLHARVLAHPARRPLIATTDAADAGRQAALEAVGARVARLPADRRGRVALDAVLALLRREAATSVMVEGGARVITGFLRSRQVDHVLVTIASVLVGGLRAVGRIGVDAGGGSRPPRLAQLETYRLGEDVVLSGIPLWTAP
ncbi:MAG TPA: dihydrofolate reductase family protein [Longimicrobiales bacterium]